MKSHLVTFLVCFALGAVIAVILRTALHRPYAEEAAPAGHAEHQQPMAAPMATPTPAATMPDAAPAPAGHADHAALPIAPAAKPENTICAVCGMPVNPALGMAQYEGHTIGFGCTTCPPKFAADPAKYGPSALKNQVAE